MFRCLLKSSLIFAQNQPRIFPQPRALHPNMSMLRFALEIFGLFEVVYFEQGWSQGEGGGLAPSNINNRTLCQNDYNFLFCFATAMLEFVGHVINC
jgi:hypothetical protein